MIYRGKEEDGRTEEDTLSKRRKKTHFRTPLTHYWFHQDLFFDRHFEGDQLLVEGLNGVNNRLFTDMLLIKIETHLVDSVQRKVLLVVQIDQPRRVVRPVLDMGGNTGRPRGLDQLAGNRAALSFNPVFSYFEFLCWQVKHLSGFVILLKGW